MRGDGRTFQRHRAGCAKTEDCGCAWWLAYCHRGKEIREPGGRTEKKAKQQLRKRLGEIAADRFIGPSEERLTVGELLDALSTHLETKGARGELARLGDQGSAPILRRGARPLAQRSADRALPGGGAEDRRTEGAGDHQPRGPGR